MDFHRSLCLSYLIIWVPQFIEADRSSKWSIPNALTYLTPKPSWKVLPNSIKWDPNQIKINSSKPTVHSQWNLQIVCVLKSVKWFGSKNLDSCRLTESNMPFLGGVSLTCFTGHIHRAAQLFLMRSLLSLSSRVFCIQWYVCVSSFSHLLLLFEDPVFTLTPLGFHFSSLVGLPMEDLQTEHDPEMWASVLWWLILKHDSWFRYAKTFSGGAGRILGMQLSHLDLCLLFILGIQLTHLDLCLLIILGMQLTHLDLSLLIILGMQLTHLDLCLLFILDMQLTHLDLCLLFILDMQLTHLDLCLLFILRLRPIQSFCLHGKDRNLSMQRQKPLNAKQWQQSENDLQLLPSSLQVQVGTLFFYRPKYPHSNLSPFYSHWEHSFYPHP